MSKKIVTTIVKAHGILVTSDELEKAEISITQLEKAYNEKYNNLKRQINIFKEKAMLNDWEETVDYLKV